MRRSIILEKYKKFEKIWFSRIPVIKKPVFVEHSLLTQMLRGTHLSLVDAAVAAHYCDITDTMNKLRIQVTYIGD